MPRFSIITCTRNSMPTLVETVRSVREQVFKDYEHIFVDGVSSDGTLDYLRTLGPDVRIVEGVASGIGGAMNAGIAAARGTFIAHLHADDYYAGPNVLQTVAEVLDSTGAQWAFGRCLTDLGGKRLPEGHRVPTYSYGQLIKRNFVPHPAAFVAKSLFEVCGVFDPCIKYAMDYDLWLRLGKVAEPAQIDEHLAVFRVHAGSLSSANRMAAFEDDWRVRQRYISKNVWTLFHHRARYWVRRRRIARQLAQGVR